MKLPDEAEHREILPTTSSRPRTRPPRRPSHGALARADGVDWYEENGTAIDEAAFALCRLRRAQAGLKGGPQAGRRGRPAGARAGEPGGVLWLASRAISYIDETGFPEAVEPWFQGSWTRRLSAQEDPLQGRLRGPARAGRRPG